MYLFQSIVFLVISNNIYNWLELYIFLNYSDRDCVSLKNGEIQNLVSLENLER